MKLSSEEVALWVKGMKGYSLRKENQLSNELGSFPV